MKKAWLTGPVLFVFLLAALLVTWAVMEPAALVANFDSDGRSPFELATLPFYLAIVPFVWWKCPFDGSRRRQIILCLMVSVVAVMAVVKQLDFHQVVLHAAYPQYVGEDGGLVAGQLVRPNGKPLVGTPFKMRVLRCLRGGLCVLGPSLGEGCFHASARLVGVGLIWRKRCHRPNLRPPSVLGGSRLWS